MSASSSNPLQPQSREENIRQGKRLLTTDAEGSSANLEYEWYLDTGCSQHMCGRRELFSDLDETVDGDVSLADGVKIPVKGRGKVKIRTREGNDFIITDVFFLPDLHLNLLSAGQFSERGYSILIKNEICTIQTSTSGVVATIPMTRNRLFPWIVQNGNREEPDVVEIVQPDKERVIMKIEDSDGDGNAPDTILPSSSSVPSTSERPKRRRTIPTRFRDFVITDNNDSDDDLTNARLVNFCQFIS